MKKYFCLSLMFLFMLHLLTGCWSKKELNQLAIATALGIDKAKGGYLITVQILNPAELAGKSNTGRTEVLRFKHTGRTVFEALRKLSTDAPRKIYVSHLSEVIIGEELAREGIGSVLDFLSRDHEMRADFLITVAKGTTASEILNVQTALEKVPAKKIVDSLENSEKDWSPTKTFIIDDLISSIISNGKEPVLTGIYVYGNSDSGSKFENVQDISPQTGIRIDSLGVFKKDKLLGWLTEEESKGYNYIVNNINNTAIIVPCSGGIATIEVIRSKTKMNGRMVNGRPTMDINVITHGNIGEVACNIDLSKQESIKKLESKYKKYIISRIHSSIKMAQVEYQSDIFGFGEAIHRSNPKAWKQLEPVWPQEFAKLHVNINVNAKLHHLGTISDSFQQEIKE